MDWAEESFNEIYRSILNDHLEVSKPLVLAALRKAKADGMREAAQIVDDKAHPDSRVTSIETSKDERYHYTKIKTAGLSDLIRAAANTLQHTEGNG